MNPRTLIVGAALLGPALLGMAPQERGGGAPRPGRILWIFLSLAETDLRADLREVARLRRQGVRFQIRPTLLMEDFSAMKIPKEVHIQNVKALADLVGPGFRLPLLDEEGLATARVLRIERTPAFALLDPSSGRAHVVYGRGARLSEVFSCE